MARRGSRAERVSKGGGTTETDTTEVPGRPRLLLQTEGRFPPDTSYVLRAACCCSSGSLTAPMSPHNISTHPMHRRPFWAAESPPGTCTPVPAGSPTRCVHKSGSGSRQGWAAGSREPSGNAHGVGEQVLPRAVVTNSCRLCGPKQLWSFSRCSGGHKSARGSSDQNQGVGRMCAPAALGGVRSLPSPASGAASLPPRGLSCIFSASGVSTAFCPCQLPPRFPLRHSRLHSGPIQTTRGNPPISRSLTESHRQSLFRRAGNIHGFRGSGPGYPGGP